MQNILVTLPKWLQRLYMVNILKNILFQNQEADDLGTWYVALGM